MTVMELKLVYNVTRLVINDELILPENYTKFNDYKIFKVNCLANGEANLLCEAPRTISQLLDIIKMLKLEMVFIKTEGKSDIISKYELENNKEAGFKEALIVNSERGYMEIVID